MANMVLRLFIIIFSLILTACSTPSYDRSPAPVLSGVANQAKTSTTAYYRVKQGDTLYAVAWRFGLDYKQLAKLNQLSEPYRLSIGQNIRLKSTVPLKEKTLVTRSTKQTHLIAKQAPKKRTQSTHHPAKPKKHIRSTTLGRWHWPAKGPVIRGFNSTSNKGIDIAGHRGQSVIASQSGRVVYAGTGLQGYGRLIIIKHNDRYLSAYAHNHKIFVKEGQTVRAGQKIAEMGSSDTNRVELHFEIRKDGNPVNPKRYLPKTYG